MADFSGDPPYWSETPQYNNYDSNFIDQSHLDFQSFDQTGYSNAAYSQPQSPYSASNIFTPESPVIGYADTPVVADEYGEAPLLDELEIYPERILEKSLAVLNPFHASPQSADPNFLFTETDLAGPIAFCLTLAVCLFVSGSKAHFGYIYGLSIISVVVMYFLITLMCNSTENQVSITGIASILGYCILPIVWLSLFGIFFSLTSYVGILLAIGAILLSTTSASRIFSLMTGDKNQRYLIAYPCGLVYIIFTMVVLF